jgi:hypothetical protein
VCHAAVLNKTVAGGAPGGWADMDVLTTGGQGCAGGGGAHCAGQSDDEYRTEAALWAIFQSPLVVATDVRAFTPIMRSILLNPELVAMHQSTATPPGRRLTLPSAMEFASATGTAVVPTTHAITHPDRMCSSIVPPSCAVFGRRLAMNGSEWLLALTNLHDSSAQTITASWEMLEWALETKARVRDVWAQRDLPDATAGHVSASVKPHGSALLRLWRIPHP